MFIEVEYSPFFDGTSACRSSRFGTMQLAGGRFLGRAWCFGVLKILDLLGNRIITLPECLGQFIQLQQLKVVDCKRLREIRCLPPNLAHFNAEGCESLESCVGLSRNRRCHSDESPWTRQINFYNCHKLICNQCTGENEMLFDKSSRLAGLIWGFLSEHSLPRKRDFGFL
ncbi:hypothetical protein MLD38_037811 [Melastoma candidum]|uniref:Uncharacterized protein n=1 Tax=Melastoma candidum TaxID=119954 RepID=A0ACB9LPV8_9MYRT|nr:hypothetical protein MLD38_037811 [Melastoma candidum]